MAKEKKEFLALKDGQIMYYYSTEGAMDDKVMQNRLLTAGYLTAIINIVENSSRGNIISSMEMGNKHIFLQKGHFLPIIFVFVIHTSKVKEKREQKKFDATVGQFEEMFTIESVKTWNGSVRAFEKFNSLVKDLF